MQALLSFEQAPPIAAPFRFFLTAPLFSGLAGLLLLVDGPELLSSRWTPGALALTHLIAAGFVLQVMLGAMIQILPVVAGANLRHPLAVAGAVHALFASGVLVLVAGFLGLSPHAFPLAMLLLAAGLGSFLFMTALSLRAVPSSSASIGGFKLALGALVVVLALGLSLVGALEGRWSLPVIVVTQLHVNWALAAWGLGLLSAVAYVVVPMFQLTPGYPTWFSRHFGLLLIGAVTATSLVVIWPVPALADALQAMLVWLGAGFCAITLWLQSRSKRARPDVTQRLWRGAMFAGLAACALWCTVYLVPALADWPAWPLLFGVLVLAGGFMSVIIGMLYKIVPFLVWLHLQNRGQGKVVAPNMKAVLAEAPMKRHLRAHQASCLLLVVATVWPPVLAQLAGLAMLLASGLLAANLLSAVRVYRRHAALVDARLATLSTGSGA
ncbi:MAG: hypothetical protein QG672_798 [Pseudomonadota bacterium]|nr:hypothetical protein [Pseudomonadota bacterium]